MRPLTSNKLTEFLERFQNFEDAEFRSLDVINATTIKATFALQDRAREFNWITIELEFNGISDAKLIDNNKLPFVDMSDGITLVTGSNRFGFSIGKYTFSSINDALCYIVFDTLKYQESNF